MQIHPSGTVHGWIYQAKSRHFFLNHTSGSIHTFTVPVKEAILSTKTEVGDHLFFQPMASQNLPQGAGRPSGSMVGRWKLFHCASKMCTTTILDPGHMLSGNKRCVWTSIHFNFLKKSPKWDVLCLLPPQYAHCFLHHTHFLLKQLHLSIFYVLRKWMEDFHKRKLCSCGFYWYISW